MLEQRLALSADSFGPCLLPEEAVIRSETSFESVASVSANEINRVTVFSGKGSADSNGVFAEVVGPDEATIARLRVNSTVRGVQGSAVVDSNSDGEFVVAWSGRGLGDKNGIFFQRFDADGMPQDSGTSVGEMRVNTTVGGVQKAPAVVMAEDGSFVIAWSGVGDGDGSGVFLRRFDAEGEADGAEVLVNTETANRQEAASLAFNTDGELIVAWQSLHQDGDEDWGVYAQRYSVMGTAVGEETRLSITTDGSQKSPTLATDPTGGIVAAWQSRGQDGDGWGVVARHFENDLTPSDPEVMLNDSTAGDQQNVAIGVAADGQWLAAWSTGVHDGAGWEVATRSFSGDGSASEAEEIDEDSGGMNSGHQHSPQVSIAGGVAQVVWAGTSRSGSEGGFSQNYDLVLVDNGTPSAPELATVSDRQAVVGNPIEITVTASDANSLDELTFELDFSESPADATIEQIDNQTAIIRWTPGESDFGNDIGFRVRVTDNGQSPLSDVEDFEVEVANRTLFLDLNGSVVGSDSTAEFVVGGGVATIADANLRIIEAGDGMVLGATARLVATPDGSAESLSVDTSGTSITADYDFVTRTLTLSGSDSSANYQQVLRTLAYNNTANSTNGNRTVVVRVEDINESASQTISVVALAPDLVEFAKGIAASGARFFGAGWHPASTAQKQLFQDGADHLPFMEATESDQTISEEADQLGIDLNGLPTWIFDDDSRLVGVQSLQTLSERTGVAIPSSKDPKMAEIADTTLLVGSPLHVSLDGYDPNGGALTYTVTSDNADVAATILSGNRSARVSVEGYGDMVFELFEQRAERATSRMIELAEDDFYEDIIFHRVDDDFVLQGGDPDGDGTGGSTLGNFDDQFHVDLQHNRTGLLSMAKSSDDTNDSQFFITEGTARHLDFNHTIFGVLIEGEANREAISETAVHAPPGAPVGTIPTIPDNDVVMEGIEIFDDIENGVLMLKAADGATGSANITVTVTDEDGNSFDRTFRVDLAPDTSDSSSNSRPFLDDVAPMSFPSNMPAEIQLTSTDVEGDDVFYFSAQTGPVLYTVDVSPAGVVTVTPPTDFVGEVEVIVAVGPNSNSPLEHLDVQTIQVEFT